MIKIKKEFKSLIPNLTKEEFKQLEQNCLDEGIREKILVWNGYIIDGHNRYEISLKWNLEIQTETKHFKDEEAVKEWMILNQFGRRNLSNYQRSVLALQLEEVFSKKAKERKAKKVAHFRNTGKVMATLPQPKTREELSKVAQVGERTLAKVKKIQAQASEEVKAKLSTGEVSINSAYQDIKKEEKKQKYKANVLKSRINPSVTDNIKNGDSLEILEKLEDKSIDIVLTDPPYGISYISNRSMFDNAVTKRGLLNDEKNKALDLLDKTCEILQRKTAENSHLYFFCSWNVFSSFESIINKYFTIKTPIIWDKGNKGAGDLENDWGNQTEIIIYCSKGKKIINKRRGNILNVSRLHSSKMVHPTQKPIELIKEILKVSMTEGDFIVDPFMGSGSTIKAANELGLKSLGIELDKEMFYIANDFINV